MHFVLPADVDDPASPSGGNVYDLRVGAGLNRLTVAGDWPRPHDTTALEQTLAGIPDGDVVLVDGLVGCGLPEVVVPHARRLKLAVLVHLPLADETGLDPATAALLDEKERQVLRAASAVIATSPTAAHNLRARHGLGTVHVVVPGTDPAPVARGADGVSQLLCVASITPRKGHDLLVRALQKIDHEFRLVCVGPHRPFLETLPHDDRVSFPGPLTGEALTSAYAKSDLFVLASRAETWGMVVTEALARGLPVIASAVPDALGDGGLLLPAGDQDALEAALTQWFHDPEFRRELRAKALTRRASLSTWDESTEDLRRVLASLRP
ncbi:glycosyltransferase involved in cell wall biosynthesis [Lentzea atacamensis]|uniref:Glycosyltransferase involved in cell wall biosynthesis n=2 Tax=Lentzea TaxID=165301 RepID=A0A316HRR0_9PSEU|nr:glycosyltransferase family 4 protein [Lentzea atacamensis]PWK83325.1 glycosyltransferase involved in cell wall biosynthesis [Lentzea atacamensis]